MSKNDESIDETYLDPKEQKLKVTLYLDGDIYDKAKSEAKKQGKKYQRLINEVLREVLINNATVQKLEGYRVISELLERVEKLEKQSEHKKVKKKA